MQKRQRIILIAIAGVFTVLFLPSLIQWMHGRAKFVRNAANFTRGGIERISVAHEFGGAPILEVNEPRLCERFYDAVTQQEDYFPNHPLYELEVCVTITLKVGDPIQLVAATMPSKDYAYCQYVRSSGNSKLYYRAFKSLELYRWLVENGIAEQAAVGQPATPPRVGD
ncbi:hypothetical protein JIN85_19410 [Luteolibacter pohnpeiensis]|uniref:Uncharacterized protein n=1 Tax=Luteolibacter pohnpeiensis TaxID=454153 RepID=A0A934SA17_9BACT|nr:hypothetical protein [Luteolibacter pohnpeiensis]MBK1884593.1 hypothetical protein [Luteolibacter pohnpeiensis]